MRPYTLPADEIRLAAKTGFLSKKLWQKYNKYRSRSGAQERWKGFTDRKLFLPYNWDDSGRTLVLNKKSFHVRGIVSNFIVKPPHPILMRHEEKVVDIVLDLNKKCNFDEYYFSEEIRANLGYFKLRKYDKVPDAILVKGDKSFAVEVELSRKGAKRYQKAMLKYELCDNYEAIYYFVITNQIKRHLLQAAEKVKYNFDETPILFEKINF